MSTLHRIIGCVETQAHGAASSDSSLRIRHATRLALEACWLAPVLLVPLAVNPWGFNYELPKVALFRALTLALAGAHILRAAWYPAPRERGWLRRPLVIAALLVAGVLVLTTVVSVSPRVSLWGSAYRQQGMYLVACLILWALLVAANLRSAAQRHRLANTIVVSGTAVALTPFAEAARWGESLLSWRPGGSLGNPIFLGGYLIMVLPFTLSALVESVRGRPRRWSWVATYSAALAFQTLALLVTQSRGPWLGGLAGLALLAALMLWKRHRWLVIAGFGLGLVAAVALFLGLNFGLSPASPLASLPYVERIMLSEDAQRGTVEVRLLLWRAVAGVVTSWPEVGLEPDRFGAIRPLVGYGPDTASIVYTAAYPPKLAHIEDPSAIWDRAHNETLDLLAMSGWLGIASAAALAFACGRRALSLWRGASNPTEQVWAAAPLSALVAHAVEVQFAFSLTSVAMMTWLCVAWLAAPAPLSARGQGVAIQSSTPASAQPHRRWRVYAAVGAVFIFALAIRLEFGALWADTLVGRARELQRTGEWGESIATYDQALAIAPWESSTHQLRAETLYDLARALPQEEAGTKAGLLAAAERSLSRAIELEPLELEHYSNSGVLHAYWSEAVDPNHLQTAEFYYRQALQLAPTRAELRLDLGHVYHNHEMYELALDEYSAALAIDPQLPQAYYDSGLAWLALDRTEEARAAFHAALDLAPGCEQCAQALEELSE
jgi:tetratricopeptide (TPR) repeat protein